MHLDPQKISAFFDLGVFSNYVKPLAGILANSGPLFGTRRHYYLFLSLFLCGTGRPVLGLVPRQYTVMLVTFAIT